MAERFGTVHTEEVVTPDAVSLLDELAWFYDEPFADTSAIPTYLVSRLAARSVKVVLSGDGGDEAFGGYAPLRPRLEGSERCGAAYRRGCAAACWGRWRGPGPRPTGCRARCEPRRC